MLKLSSPSTEIVFVTQCVDPERGMWRTACCCQACCHVRCLNCGLEWLQRPDPATCPKCKHPYVEWLNYEEHRKTHRPV